MRRGKSKETIQQLVSHDCNLPWVDPATGKLPKSIGIKDLINGSARGAGPSRVIDALQATIKDGERYTIEFNWNSTGGHIISLFKEANGDIVFYDPQINHKYSSPAEQLDLMNRIRLQTIAIRRIDNLDFNMDVVGRLLT